MALLLRDLTDSYWVTDEDLAQGSRAGDIVPDPDVAFLVRPCDDDTQRAIRRDLVTYVYDRKTHSKVEKPLTPEDQAELARRVFSHIVMDWRGIVDPKTTAPVPCTDDTKRAFMRADAPRVLALFSVVNTLQSTEATARAESFRATEGVGEVVG